MICLDLWRGLEKKNVVKENVDYLLVRWWRENKMKWNKTKQNEMKRIVRKFLFGYFYPSFMNFY